MQRDKQIHEAAKQFYEALKAMDSVIDPVVMYTYSMGTDEYQEIEAGFHGRATHVLGACEQIKYNILSDAYHDAHD